MTWPHPSKCCLAFASDQIFQDCNFLQLNNLGVYIYMETRKKRYEEERMFGFRYVSENYFHAIFEACVLYKFGLGIS